MHGWGRLRAVLVLAVAAVVPWLPVTATSPTITHDQDALFGVDSAGNVRLAAPRDGGRVQLWGESVLVNDEPLATATLVRSLLAAERCPQLTLNGEAKMLDSSKHLVLINGTRAVNGKGSAFGSFTLPSTLSFEVRFTIRVTSEGDGMTFVLHPDTATYLGNGGSDLGLFPFASPFVAIMFDVYDVPESHRIQVAHSTSGAVKSEDGVVASTNDSLPCWFCNRDLDVRAVFTAKSLSVYVPASEPEPMLHAPIDLPAVLKQGPELPTVTAGFTGGYGGSFGSAVVLGLDWNQGTCHYAGYH